ncbi:hypothetical protein CHS0354_016050, partial [Potamilus streckersoni]
MKWSVEAVDFPVVEVCIDRSYIDVALVTVRSGYARAGLQEIISQYCSASLFTNPGHSLFVVTSLPPVS